ncbi:MAG: tRNA (adenosine(37)-N6)-threonylcarbamoyltransferase complex ATPase subunit type 1 TsaE, partial [Phycisphaerales bacterium]|nr:tRNA (adenosine(37)-N6)-threonylcarbamoyltransferase complex ATPase subunit type 1 TsaE [Phycisphaerales bacterium]
FEGLGVEEMLASDGAVLIEWADRVADGLPTERLTVEMNHVGATTRRIEIHGIGDGPMAVIGALSRSS